MLKVLSFFSDVMVGGDEVQEVQEGGNAQNEKQMLTDEVIGEVKEKADEKEEVNILLVLLKKTIDTIMMEEFFEANRKMNEFRRVFARGIFLFAEEQAEDTAKLDRLVGSFRSA